MNSKQRFYSKNTKLKSAAKFISLSLLAVAALAISGCTVGPDYKQPQKNVPAKWDENLPANCTTDPNELARWWKKLNDPTLNILIDKAAANNLDLANAYWRIQESRALRDFQTGRYVPEVDGVGSYSRNRESENGLTPQTPGHSPDQTNLHDVGFDASWEIDIFGQIKRSEQSAQALLESSIENYRDVMVTLFAEVARNYIDLRTIQQRITYAQENIRLQSETLNLTRERYDAGISPELDLRQAELNLYNTKSEIPNLRQAQKQAINRLAVLLNEYPVQLKQLLMEEGSIPSVSGKIATGMPANIIRQRPDIRRAERDLAAQTARIGIATADLYPSFSLTGSFLLESTTFSDLGDMSSRKYGFGPSFRWNLFSGNRIRNTIKAEEFKAKQALTAYENTVLNAIEETENAMTSYVQENKRLKSLDLSYKSSVRSVELVNSLYKSGLTDFQNVLDMQRTLFQQQDKLAQSRGLVTQNFVRIYKSLGGGWNPETEKLCCSTEREPETTKCSNESKEN